MKRVLVVDNKPVIREVVRLWMEMQGWGVMQAENGEQAKRMLLADPADAVICDLEMQPGDGLWFFGQVRGLVVERQIPFLFLAAPKSSERVSAVKMTGLPLFVKGSPGVGMPEVVDYLKQEFTSRQSV